jgi:hypothetical protein
MEDGAVRPVTKRKSNTHERRIGRWRYAGANIIRSPRTITAMGNIQRRLMANAATEKGPRIFGPKMSPASHTGTR